MECRYRVLLRCPMCMRVFCVPELAGSSVVYHGACNQPMERVDSYSADHHADRSYVCYFKDLNRLEVPRDAQRQ